MLLFSVPIRIFLKNVVAVVDLGSSRLVVSHGYVAFLQLIPDNQLKMNIAKLNVVEKKLRYVFFYVPIEVRNSLVSLTALVADGLFEDVLLGANWMKAVSACLDVGQLDWLTF